MAASRFFLLVGVTLASGFQPVARPTRALRVVAPRMDSSQDDVEAAPTWPPPLDAVHVFNIAFGSEKVKLALSQITAERSAAILPLWKLQYSTEDNDDGRRMFSGARGGGAAPSAATARVFGAYLNGLDGDEHGIAIVRFETDTHADGVVERLMIIDGVLISPQMRRQFRPPLHSAILQSLFALGEANQLSIRSWTDYDV